MTTKCQHCHSNEVALFNGTLEASSCPECLDLYQNNNMYNNAISFKQLWSPNETDQRLIIDLFKGNKIVAVLSYLNLSISLSSVDATTIEVRIRYSGLDSYRTIDEFTHTFNKKSSYTRKYTQLIKCLKNWHINKGIEHYAEVVDLKDVLTTKNIKLKKQYEELASKNAELTEVFEIMQQTLAELNKKIQQMDTHISLFKCVYVKILRLPWWKRTTNKLTKLHNEVIGKFEKDTMKDSEKHEPE